MTPQQTARADQIRAALKEALATPCSCDDCAPDDALRAALAMDDETLLAYLDGTR